ncbi:hypothetical protein C0991_009217 [Blastosporella zonata]|nr:hypothetical protein C0991_009217 [Blastosporella zonata]
MSTTTSIVFESESRFPSIIRVSTSVPLYAHILVFVSGVLVTWFAITLAISKPPTIEVRKIHSPPSVHKLKSRSPTHTDRTDGKSTRPLRAKRPAAPKHQDDAKPEVKYITFDSPFANVNAPVKLSISPSLALHPFARRLSMPGRTPICTPFAHHPFTPTHTPLREQQRATVVRHGSLSDDGESYFQRSHSSHSPSGRLSVRDEVHDSVLEEKAEEPCSGSPPEMEIRAPSVVTPPIRTKKSMKFKGVTKKLAAIFHHRSSSHHN